MADAYLRSPSTACSRTIKASVVALDQAECTTAWGNEPRRHDLRQSDVVAIDAAKGIIAGNVRCGRTKRWPIVCAEQWRLSAK